MIVYRHIRLDKNEVFYVGIGKTENRAYEKRGRNNYWKNIIKQTEYKVDILFNDLTWEEACDKEKEFIQLYGRKDLGLGTLVNMTDGGEGTIGFKPTDETKQKMSEAHTGERNPFFGKKHDDETKKKISQIAKGKKHSEDRKNNSKKSRRDIYSEKNVGVFFNTKQNRWISRIYVDGIQYYLGSFTNYEDALKVRKDAENIYW